MPLAPGVCEPDPLNRRCVAPFHDVESDTVRCRATLCSTIQPTFGHDPDFTPADLARPKL
jgi:hypothetical protein